MTNMSMAEVLNNLYQNKSFNDAQKLSGAAAVAMFLRVRDGLSPYVREEELDSIAATLAAGVMAAPSNID